MSGLHLPRAVTSLPCNSSKGSECTCSAAVRSVRNVPCAPLYGMVVAPIRHVRHSLFLTRTSARTSAHCNNVLCPATLTDSDQALCTSQVRNWISRMKEEGKAFYRGNTYLLAGVRLQKQVRASPGIMKCTA